MTVRLRFLTLLALAAIASPAAAANLLTDTFDGENGGSGALNYGSFAQFDVANGTVDLIRNGDYGLQCAGGSGKCIDLDGSSGVSGRLQTKSAFAVKAGETVTLAFDLSGNQRGGPADGFTAGFDFLGQTFSAGSVMATGPAGSQYNSGSGNFVGTSLFQSIGALDSATPFARYTLRFTANEAGTFKAFFRTPSRDSLGPILDNVALTRTGATAAVPDAPTWAMMVGGFGLVGGALRRRSRKPIAA